MSLFELRSDRPVVAPSSPASGMDVAALDPRRRAGDATPWWTLAAIAAVAAAALAAVVGRAVLNGDAVWHLVWGRELAHGTLDSFATGPTPHPSLLVLGAATSVLGDDASYAVTYLLFGPLAFGCLVAAVYEVARRLSSRWAGAAAVLILSTGTGVLYVAANARYDIAFAALVMAAVALEMSRPRRGAAPLACLAVAGLVRPEAWVLAGAYWLWLAPGMTWAARARLAVLAAAAPLLWSLMDTLVTGDPLYSFHVTDTASESLYGQYTVWENLTVAGRNLIWYLGAVPLILLAPAAIVAARDRARAALPPLFALAVTLAVFVALLARGMASSERYLLVPVAVLATFAAMAVDGGGRRTPRRVLAGTLLAMLLAVQVASHLDNFRSTADLSVTRAGLDRTASALVDLPGVRDALRRCETVALPTPRMRHWFAFYSGRAPETFAGDGARPDLYIAPANSDVARAVLTRERFDDDASFRVPPSLSPGPRNADWALYVAPGSACAGGLL